MLSREDRLAVAGRPKKLSTVGSRRVSTVAAEDAVELGNGVESSAIGYIGDGDSRIVEQSFGLFNAHMCDKLCER